MPSLTRTKFDFSWGSTWDPAGGAYSAPPDSLTGGVRLAASAHEPHSTHALVGFDPAVLAHFSFQILACLN